MKRFAFHCLCGATLSGILAEGQYRVMAQVFLAQHRGEGHAVTRSVTKPRGGTKTAGEIAAGGSGEP